MADVLKFMIFKVRSGEPELRTGDLIAISACAGQTQPYRWTSCGSPDCAAPLPPNFQSEIIARIFLAIIVEAKAGLIR